MERDIFNNYPFSGMGDNQGVQSDYDEFDAVELYCDKCKRAVPVRKNLLLILPEGDKYEYTCALCGNSVGDKIDKSGQYYTILKE